MAGRGGTEAFPDLGEHCQNPNCKQLDFLPFACDGCKLVFCLEHRSYKSHDCPKSDHGSRTVSICETCSIPIETTGFDEEGIKSLLKKHEGSGDCDPIKKKKKKPVCPAKRCREILSFANNLTCKDCGVKFCLKHRFPTDHVCNKKTINVVGTTSRWNEKLMEASSVRNEKGCGRGSSVSSKSPSVRSF